MYMREQECLYKRRCGNDGSSRGVEARGTLLGRVRCRAQIIPGGQGKVQRTERAG